MWKYKIALKNRILPIFLVVLLVQGVVSQVPPAQALTYQVQWISHNTPTQVFVNQTIVAGINFTIKNTSDFTWQTENSDANPIRLSYHWVNQAGQTVVWNGARSGIPGGDVPPGATVSVPASLVAPPTPGYYTLYWDLVQEGVTRFSWRGSPQAALTVHVTSPYRVQWISHSTPTQMFTGQVFQNIFFTIKNTSNFTWVSSGPNAVHLSYHWVNQAGQTVVWEGARSGLPGDISPGQETTFLGSVVAPSTPGYYTLYWDLVQEGMTWFSAQGAQQQALTVYVSPLTARVDITGNGNFQLVRASDNAVLSTLGSGQVVTVAYSGGLYYISASNGSTGITPSHIRLLPVGSTIMKITNMPQYNQFRGGVEVRYSGYSNRLWAINELGMEDYLKGIGEEPESYPYQALMAAVVAYRSYAYAVKLQGKRNKNEPFDISSSTVYQYYVGGDQWYIGYYRETLGNNLTRAVNDRAGEVLVHPSASNNQRVALTPYFARTDGRTRSWQEVWGGSGYPWLQSVPDPYCSGLSLLGHGVGMSMLGARGFALYSGWWYDQILGHYYTGVSKGNIGNPIIRVGVYSTS